MNMTMNDRAVLVALKSSRNAMVIHIIYTGNFRLVNSTVPMKPHFNATTFDRLRKMGFLDMASHRIGVTYYKINAAGRKASK